jgi:two-component system sensor histidine kinase HydH
LFLLLGLACLALAVWTVYQDRVREKATLEQLYLQKGEMLIRWFGLAHRRDWLQFDHNDLSKFFEQKENQDVLILAVTKADGTITATSEADDSLLSPETFQNPEQVEAFHPNWLPKSRKSRLKDGHFIFWVYRPLLHTVEKPKPMMPHNDPGQGHPTDDKGDHGRNAPPPIWPPEIDFQSAPENAVYLWIGFDGKTFEAATVAALRNLIFFSILIGVNLLTMAMAIYWAMRYARSLAITKEIINRLPIGLILNNLNGQVAIVNPAALKICGLRLDQVQGKTMAELTDGTFPEDREGAAIERDVTFQGGLSPRLSIACGPVTLRNGTEIGRVVLMADLEEIDHLKRELSKNERLARLFGIASGLAHNIRNPLGSIKSLAQYLKDKNPAKEDLDALDLILNSADGLSRTVDDFLDFASPVIKTEETDLTEVVKSLHHELEEKAAGSGVSLSLSLPEGPCIVLADSLRLKSALSHIYTNSLESVKSNPPGQPGLIDVALVLVGQSKAMLKIHDNGQGFSAKQLATPFVPYFTTKPNNTGLGLAKTNNILQAFNGNVQLANALDGGALVTITLPIFPDPGVNVKIAPLELGEFLTKIHNQVSLDPKTENIDLTLEVLSQPLTIMADESSLQEMIHGLYQNAIRAMSQNPPDQAPTMTVTLASDESGQAVMTWADNGPGFTEAQSRAPFEATSADRLHGTGFSLFIIKSIVEAHKGHIKLANLKGRGGLVTISLPLAKVN